MERKEEKGGKEQSSNRASTVMGYTTHTYEQTYVAWAKWSSPEKWLMGARGHVPAEEEQTLSLTVNYQEEVPMHFGVSKVDINTEKL